MKIETRVLFRFACRNWKNFIFYFFIFISFCFAFRKKKQKEQETNLDLKTFQSGTSKQIALLPSFCLQTKYISCIDLKTNRRTATCIFPIFFFIISKMGFEKCEFTSNSSVNREFGGVIKLINKVYTVQIQTLGYDK